MAAKVFPSEKYRAAARKRVEKPASKFAPIGPLRQRGAPSSVKNNEAIKSQMMVMAAAKKRLASKTTKRGAFKGLQKRI